LIQRVPCFSSFKIEPLQFKSSRFFPTAVHHASLPRCSYVQIFLWQFPTAHCLHASRFSLLQVFFPLEFACSFLASRFFPVQAPPMLHGRGGAHRQHTCRHHDSPLRRLPVLDQRQPKGGNSSGRHGASARGTTTTITAPGSAVSTSRSDDSPSYARPSTRIHLRSKFEQAASDPRRYRLQVTPPSHLSLCRLTTSSFLLIGAGGRRRQVAGVGSKDIVDAARTPALFSDFFCFFNL
jgi:hypothetical protein